MKVYMLTMEENFQKLLLKDETEWAAFSEQFKEKRLDDWAPPDVTIDEEELPPSDYPTLLQFIPTFSQNAIECLRSGLENNGQILPVVCDSKTYYYYNVLTLLDVLNEDKSSLVKFDDGRIMHIMKCTLKKIDYSEHFIFKLSSERASSVFVNQIFVDIVKTNDLKGFKFVEVETEN